MNMVTLGSPDYPRRLQELHDAPSHLYYLGKLPEEGKKSAAIVGARSCTPYGRAIACEIGRRLARAGIEIISGLAYGIDCAAQSGALEGGGTTYSVMGCGADICYPMANRGLYERMKQSGGILSEYPAGTKPHPGRFPQRNRMISALADAVIIVEAKEKSGALITADFALEQGKEVYAVPGRLTDECSKGTNYLIAQGAAVYYSTKEFLQDMGLEEGKIDLEKNYFRNPLEKKERMVYSVLDLSPKDLDTLAKLTRFGIVELIGILGKLLQGGYIEETYKNHYIRRIHAADM